MLKRIDLALALALLLLGVAHTALTPYFYRGFTLDALWFAGTGLSLIFAALLHLVRRDSESTRASWAAFYSGLGAAAFTVLLAVKLRQPQAYAVLVILGSLCVTSWLSRKSQDRSPKSLEEVRSRIDDLDRRIVDLLARRGRQVMAAASFKTSPEEVRASRRVEEVIAKVRGLSKEFEAHPGVVETTYRAMISAFIEMEMEERNTTQHQTSTPKETA
jgi:isochorismate pyruvate lyase